MRFAVVIAFIACSGPISPPYAGYSNAGRAQVIRPPPNAPPDPIGSVRPGNRSCTEDRDCRVGERCYPPDHEPASSPAPAAAAPAAPTTATDTAGPRSVSAAGLPPPAGTPRSVSAAAPPTSPPPAGSLPPGGAPTAGSPSPGGAPTAGSTPPSSALPTGTAPAGPAAPNAPHLPSASAAPPGLPPPGSPVPSAAPGDGPASPTAACQADTQCAPGTVCNDGRCTPSCAAATCGSDRECRDGHCALILCTDPRAGICPLNARCNPTSGACERLACTAHAQCDSGVCFHGRCYGHDAYCAP